MSLLLLLYDPSGEPAGPIPNVDQYIRRIENWELSYTLGSTPIFRGQIVDRRVDKINAFRPLNDYRVEIRRSFDQPIFRGRIVRVTDAPLEEPNVGVKYNIDCVGESEVFESRHYSGNFGSDPKPVQSAGASVGGTTTVLMQEPHEFVVGDTIGIESVSPDGGATFSTVNGDHVITSVPNPNEFVVAVANNVASWGGTARKKVHLRTILQALESPYLTDYSYSLAPDIAQGPLLEVQKFDNATISDIFRHLSKVTGWVHRYLPNRLVEWFAPGDKVSVLSFDKTNTMGGTNWTQSRVKKANTVIVKYGGDQQVSVVETISGDGVKREWPLTHRPIVNRPISSTSAHLSIWVPEGDGGALVPRHVGVYGYDTLFEWVYRESDNTLVQLATSAGAPNAVKPLGWVASAYIEEQLPATVREVNQPLADLQGPREKLIEAPGIINRFAAIQYAKSELNGLSVTPKEAKLVTEAGLTWPGNSTSVDLPDILATGQFLLTGVVAVETERSLRYTYTALEGNEFTSTWQDRLRSLFGGGAGGGSSVVTGSIATIPGGGGGGGTVLGTTNKIPLFTSPTTVGDSVLEQTPDGSLVSTLAGIQGGSLRSNIFRGVTAGAVDAVFQNASGAAVFEVPTGTQNAKFYGDVVTERVTSESELELGATSNNVYPTGNYQTHLGGITRKWLTLHAAELWVEQLVAQETISTIGGSILVAPTTVLEADLPLAATSIVVKHNQMVAGDRVMMKGFGKFEVMSITSGPTGTGPYTYVVTRDLDGSGATDWYAGDAVVNTQKSFIDIYSIRGTKSASEVGPTLVGNVRTGTGAIDWEPRWALGNLRGIYGYAVGTDVFGFAAGVRTGAWLSVDATNGFRMMFNNTVVAQITAAGSASFTGSVTVTGGNAATVDMANVLEATIRNKTGWGHPTDTTLINGANIYTGTVTLSALNFTPVQTSNVVASINASGEGIRISGSRITIDGTVNFGAGYNPAEKIPSGGAATDINNNITTISGGKITTGSITADKLSVTSLSAITANMGTVTAGTINGATFYAGGSNVTLDGNGLTLTGGASNVNQVKWTNGAWISGNGAYLSLAGPTYVTLDTPGGSVGLTSGAFWPATQITLGTNAARWGTFYLAGDIYWTNPPATTFQDHPLVWSVGNGLVYRRTDGFTGSASNPSFIDVRGGLVVDLL